MTVKAEEVRILLQNGETLIRTEEGIYFLKVGDAPAILEDPNGAADALLNELLSTQAERNVYKRELDVFTDKYFKLDKTTQAMSKAIESYQRIEKDMEDDYQRFLAKIERLEAEKVRLVALAGAGYEKLVEALREIDTHIRATPDPVPYIVETLKKTLPEYREESGCKQDVSWTKQ